jgi:hypothetical protein
MSDSSSVPSVDVELSDTCGIWLANKAHPVLIGVAERESQRVASRIFLSKIPGLVVPYRIESSHPSVRYVISSRRSPSISRIWNCVTQLGTVAPDVTESFCRVNCL